VPLRIEVGPRDLEAQAMMVSRRDKPHKEKQSITLDQIGNEIVTLLQSIQDNYFAEALKYRDSNIKRDLKTFDEMKQFFIPKNAEKPEIHGGFVLAKWCGDTETEKMLDEHKISIRCLPLQQSETEGICILTGRKATLDAIFSKSY
jgi:prolyl-tRNA synthetase